MIMWVIIRAVFNKCFGEQRMVLEGHQGAYVLAGNEDTSTYTSNALWTTNVHRWDAR